MLMRLFPKLLCWLGFHCLDMTDTSHYRKCWYCGEVIEVEE